MSRPGALAGLLLIPFLSGCPNGVVYTMTAELPRALPSRPVDSVEVFTLTPPVRPHTVIGIIQVVQPGWPKDSSVQRMVADARLRAATMGCDAILINSIDRRRGKYNTMSVQAGCVVYTEPPHAERPPSAPPPLAPRPD